MTRRNFARNSLGALAGLLVLNMGQCAGGANEMLNKLRNILKAVESALTALGLLGPLLPEIVHTVREYLSAVAQFVDDAAIILENEVKSATEKAQAILAMVGKVNLPQIQNDKVMAILNLVDAAINAFLALFGASTKEARTAAVPSKIPDAKVSEADRRYLATIEVEAMVAQSLIRQWADKAAKS